MLKPLVPTTDIEALPTTRARWAMACLALSMLMPSLDTSIANVALPSLAQAFAVPFSAVQWVVVAYLLAITTLIVGAGRLGDLFGRRRLLLGGIGLFTLASLACGAAPTLGLLIAARAAQGLGAAVMMALTVAMVGETVPKAKTGSAMGLLGAMSALGTALGPSLGGLLIAGFGWRTIFLINVPLGIINLALAWRYLPHDRQVERTSSAVIPLSVFRDRGLCGSLAMNLLVAMVMMTTLVVGPFYLSRTLDLGPALVGFVMSVGPVISAISGIVAGRLVDRLGTKIMIIAGLGAMATGLAGLCVLPVLLGVAGYIAAIAMVTPGYQLFLTANTTTVMRDVATDRRGVISGLLSLSRNIGLIGGASVMGTVFAVTGSITITFAVAAGLMVVALAGFTIRWPR